MSTHASEIKILHAHKCNGNKYARDNWHKDINIFKKCFRLEEIVFVNNHELRSACETRLSFMDKFRYCCMVCKLCWLVN